MLDRHFVQSFLTMNNLQPQMSDAELVNAFRYAGWSQSEIERAITIIRNDDPKVQSINDVRYGDILNSGSRLSSEDLSWLLGVDVIVDPESVRGAKHRYDRENRLLDALVIGSGVILAIVCAFTLVWFLMTFTDLS